MYRMVDCSTWDDPWFAEELNPEQKLLFLYFLTNRRSTPAGCFEITIRAMSFETGISVNRVTEILSSFGDRIVWWPEHQIIWVKNFFRRQLGERPNPKYRDGAIKALSAMPADVKERVCKEYPDLSQVLDTPPMPHTSPMEEASPVLVVGVEVVPVDQEKNSVSPETVPTDPNQPPAENPPPPVETPKNGKAPPNYTPDFLTFWSAYPRGHGNKQTAFAEWRQLKPDSETQAAILAGIDRWKRSRKWKDGFVRDAERFLKLRMWEDEVEPVPLPPLPPDLQKRVETVDAEQRYRNQPIGVYPEQLQRDINAFYAKSGASP